MKCVVLQPAYIPWRGYFHEILKSDVFVFYDDIQYDDRGWRNRNRVKSPTGSRWLTIPVSSKGAQINKIPINEIRICWDEEWNAKHWNSIKHLYGKAPYFKLYEGLLAEFYIRRPVLLADFTIELTIALANCLGIEGTRFVRSSSLKVDGNKTERLINILQLCGATHYITGPSARAYLEEERFSSAGISLEYMMYNYPAYPQLYPPYDSQVSILDLLFMTGHAAADFIQDKGT